MISVKTFSLNGEALKDTSLPEEIFGVKVNPTLLAQAVRVYLSNQRQGSAKTKGRGEVAGSTRKLYRQKGTGRARRGSLRSPVAVGGGIAHGPSGRQNHQLTLPAAMKRLAFLGALSAKAAKGEVSVITGADEATGKTQETKKISSGRTLIITTPALDKFNRSVRNLDQVQVATTSNVNTYQILAHSQLILTKEAVTELKKKYVA
jgi:large subunit ribosomal protein L4